MFGALRLKKASLHSFIQKTPGGSRGSGKSIAMFERCSILPVLRKFQ